MGEKTRIIEELRYIVTRYEDKIGTIDTPEYNEQLDNICLELSHIVHINEV